MKTEFYYAKNAKLGCQECRGKGMVWDYHAQDSATLEPCSTCFPDDPRVVQLREAKSQHAYLESKSGTVAVPIP